MKKLFALLAVLCLMTAAVAALAEPAAEPFTFRNGIAFGMTEDEVMAAEAGNRCERDADYTFGAAFTSLEFEHVREAEYTTDLKYFFVDGALVAIRANIDTWQLPYEQLLANLTERFGEPAPLDPATLGNAVYAVDDEGRPEFGAVVFNAGDVLVVLELDEDDIDVTFLDMTAAYVR